MRINVLFLDSYAKIECKAITGQSKGVAYYPGMFHPKHMSSAPGDHAWTAMKLHGEWFLSDPTWAVGARGSLHPEVINLFIVVITNSRWL